VVVLLFLFLFKFVLDTKVTNAIKNIIALIAILQWLFGAILSYLFDDLIFLGYRMVLPSNVYFFYVLPATLVFIIGLFIIPSKLKIDKNVNQLNKFYLYRKGILLVLIGFLIDFMGFRGFLPYLLSNLKYVGFFYIYFSNHKYNIFWLIFIFSYLLTQSFASGLFHDLLLWGTFFITIFFSLKNSRILYRLLFVLFGFFIIFLIHISKPDIREDNWATNKTKIELLINGMNTLTNKIFGEQKILTETNIGYTITRLNQGWIISNVMEYVPGHKPFAYGKSIKDAIIASIFPRFLMPNKVTATGHFNMENYAGISLAAGTAMDISQVGEAYANFGVYGGVVFMFFLGIFFAWLIKFIEKLSSKQPELIFWLPLLFLQAIKAESSLAIVLNHITKSGIVIWFFFTPVIKQQMNRIILRH